jgi:hypothetical protein
MPRHWLFTLTLVLLAAVTALVLWPEPAAVTVETGENGATVEQENLVDRDEAVTEASPLHAGESHLNTRVEEASVPENSDSSATYPAYSGANGVMVVVLDEKTELPVPQTDLYYLNPRDLDQSKVRGLGGTNDFKLIIRKFGQHYRSDAQGQVQIAPLADYALLLAEKGDRAQLLSPVVAIENQIVVRLRDNVGLSVRVADAAGFPAIGAPVAIRMVSSSSSYPSLSTRTGSDGKANWTDLNTLIERLPKGSKLYASIEIPIKPENVTESQRVELTDQVLQAGTATLTMPPTGQVRVTVVDSRGERYQGTGQVRVFSNADQASLALRTSSSTESVTDGIAEFPFVALGSPLEITFLAEGSNNQDRAHIDSPQRAGEWVETTLIHADRPTLTGVLLDPDGVLLRDQSLSISLTTKSEKGGSSRIGTSLSTDSEGRFRYELRESSGQGYIKSRAFGLKTNLEKFGKCRLEQTLPNEILAGDFDLGELTLLREPFLIAGRVLDLQGVPIAQASVQIFGASDLDIRARMFFRGAGSRNIMMSGIGDRTDLEGNFRLQGEMEQSDSLQVEISAKGYETLRQPVSLGSEGLEFRLNPASVLIGSVLLAEGIRPSTLQITVSAGEKDEFITLRSSSGSTAHELRFEGKANTTYVLKIATRHDEVIFESAPFQLQPGIETRPPELQPLDLRDVLRSITIRAQDSAGVSLAASVYAQSSDQSWSGEQGGPEGVTFLLNNPIANLYVQAEGYAGQMLENVSSDQMVTLQPGMEITLQIPANLVHYREFSLSVNAMTVARNRNGPTISQVKISSFDSSGRATMAAPQSGDHFFTLRIQPAPGHPGRSSTMSLGIYKITASGQVINLKIDQVELDKKIDGLTD